MDPLARITDPVLGDLTWDGGDSCWSRELTVRGRPVLLALHTGLVDPSAEEKLAVVEASRPLLAAILAAEPSLRLRTAQDLAGAEFAGRTTAARLERSLRLVDISLGVCRQLDYHLKSLFRRLTVSVYLEDDLSYREIEIY